jgi:hypothetical protein
MECDQLCQYVHEAQIKKTSQTSYCAEVLFLPTGGRYNTPRNGFDPPDKEFVGRLIKLPTFFVKVRRGVIHGGEAYES